MVFINNYNEFLAQTRLRQGRDFDELSISSGVAVAHLRAIEKADTHPFYSRNYYERCVMKYASVLGVDEEIVVKQPTQGELPLQAEQPVGRAEASERVSTLSDGDDEGTPALPPELFASRGPLVPPESAKPSVSAKPEAVPPLAKAEPAEAPPVNAASLDEFLPPKIDLTPPKAGFGFPLILVAVGVTIALALFAWQHFGEQPRTEVASQQTGRPEAGAESAKPGETQTAATSNAPAAAPASAPAPVAVDESAKLKAEVERDFALWIKQWGDRNAEGHLAFFDASFPDFKKYADNRRKRIAAAKFIEVSASDIVIEKLKDDQFAVRFVQSYRSDTFASKDSKELIWKKTAKGMKIVSEQVLK